MSDWLSLKLVLIILSHAFKHWIVLQFKGTILE